MPHIHGKGAIIYLGTGGGTAVAVGEQVSWSINFDMQLVDVTPLNNTWKTFVKGLQGWTGAFAGNYDTANKALWTASNDTVLNNFYLYPEGVGGVTRFYSGTCWIQLGKIADGSTTSKAGNDFKATGDGALAVNP